MAEGANSKGVSDGKTDVEIHRDDVLPAAVRAGNPDGAGVGGRDLAGSQPPVADAPTEPIPEIPEPVQEIPEPEASQIPEPLASDSETSGYEMPEPIPEIPEPVQMISGLSSDSEIEIDADEALSRDRRLWNLETYKDRHGKYRAKRVLRFVTSPPKREIGKVTESIAEELRARRGKGRWKLSREEAEELRRNAELVAESIRRDKRQRNKRRINAVGGSDQNNSSGRPLLPETEDASQWGDLPVWRM